MNDRPLLRITDNGQAGVRLDGEVDISNLHELQEVLERALAKGSDVWLDLSGLTFIDVGGMRALYRATLQLREDGKVLTLVSPPATLRRMLAIVGVDMLGSLQIPDSGKTG
jgi:anti-anti-sigma factor